MTFGGVDKDLMLPYPTAEDKKLYYYENFHDDQEWGSEVRNVLVCDPNGRITLDNGYKTYAKVDSFSPYIQLPKENFKMYTDYVEKKYPDIKCND